MTQAGVALCVSASTLLSGDLFCVVVAFLWPLEAGDTTPSCVENKNGNSKHDP